MLTIYNDRHALHHGKVEMFRGELVPCFEVPARADFVLRELRERELGLIETPDAFDDAAIARIHAPRYLEFLAGAWDEWVAGPGQRGARCAAFLLADPHLPLRRAARELPGPHGVVLLRRRHAADRRHLGRGARGRGLRADRHAPRVAG